jgi:uracil-DNA glycosylase family 4
VEPAEMLKEIAQQVSVCQKCILKNTRKHSVPGEGPASAEVMLIGEGPGFHENEQGRPFVGAAGKLLDELLQKGGLSRSQVFITNVVKCRPPGNRDPGPDELEACSTYLDNQIEVINPSVIMTLGRFSMARYFPTAKISTVHGQPLWIKGRLIVPLYHPAAALHQPALKTTLEKDFARLSVWVDQARKNKKNTMSLVDNLSSEPKTDPTQLTLF